MQTIEQEEYDYEQKTGRNENYYRRLTPKVRSACVYKVLTARNVLCVLCVVIYLLIIAVSYIHNMYITLCN